MLTTLRKRMASEESGFTLVELLVVMLILGILAAIAIPSFFAQRDKSRDADAKAQVRTAQTAMETYATDNNGSYAAADPTALNGIEETLDEANLTVTSTADTYSVQMNSDTSNAFRISRDASGNTSLTCGADTVAVGTAFGANDGGNGGCPTDETW